MASPAAHHVGMIALAAESDDARPYACSSGEVKRKLASVFLAHNHDGRQLECLRWTWRLHCAECAGPTARRWRNEINARSCRLLPWWSLDSGLISVNAKWANSLGDSAESDYSYFCGQWYRRSIVRSFRRSEEVRAEKQRRL